MATKPKPVDRRSTTATKAKPKAAKPKAKPKTAAKPKAKAKPKSRVMVVEQHGAGFLGKIFPVLGAMGL